MTTSKEAFYFDLLRVSMIQLLRSQGFDKARNSTVDIFTDFYVRYLELMVREILKLSHLRRSEEGCVELQDISLALQNIGFLKPVDVLDVYDENPDLVSDVAMQKFKSWCSSAGNRNAEIVATPTPDLLRPKEKNAKPLSVIPEYINQANSNSGSVKKTADHESAGDDILDQMINGGDMSDWIRFILRRRQINMVERVSGKEYKDLRSLPPLPGFKYSVLAQEAAVPTAELEPATDGKLEDSQLREKEKYLLSKLPINKTNTRLENITLSFDEVSHEEITDQKVQEVLQENEEFLEEHYHNEIQEFGQLDLDVNMALDANQQPEFMGEQDFDAMYNAKNGMEATNVTSGSRNFDFGDF
ncbi:LAMI_0F12662g1_1 [Lachancea mirantina]|uniref:LAMI_0F12662g1_1 n=1 Tax=Lachancea mirantina TaxID=1230905 RepID=A0A1G4K302_9SACH|nr:LAMI_0F12662g1_1 [Lachancea mirantina]